MNGSIQLTNGENIEEAPFDAARLVIPGAEPGHGMTDTEIASVIEAMLLVAPEPTSVTELAAGAELGTDDIWRGLESLERRQDSGLVMHRHGDRFTLGTAPKFASEVRRFLGLDREARISSAAMETVAIIAYRQPVTRSEIESIRGVDCSGVIATLHARELIEPVSRQQTIGNPIQYGTTARFLKHFGLSSLADLPSLGVINGESGEDVLAAAANPKQHEPPESER